MGSLINERLRKGGYTIREMAAQGKKIKELRAEKVSILKDIYRILALCLGEPPTTFTWRYKDRNGEIKELANYTPLQGDHASRLQPEKLHHDHERPDPGIL